MSKFSGKSILLGFKNFGRFLISKFFLKQIGLAVGISVALLLLTLLMLNIFTHHGEGLSVPDFTGRTLSEAKKIAEDSDLRIEVNDSVYNAPGKKGTVIDQTPPPDFKVKKDRTIHVVIKTFNPERIAIPDFTGVSLIQAKADIETYGLKIGKLTYVPDIATNNVLEQLYNGKPIPPGTIIEKNSQIDLKLGMGESNEVTTVPNLIGENRNGAVQKVTDNSLNVGAMIFDETVITTEDSAAAIVWKQTPVKYFDAKLGTPVDLWLSLNPDKTEEKNDDQ